MLNQHGQLPAPSAPIVTVLMALSAFAQEHEHCGELDSGLDGNYV